jgi:transcriptional regulator with XRE-family HTH domain
MTLSNVLAQRLIDGGRRRNPEPGGAPQDSFGVEVQKLRNRLNLSQEQFAARYCIPVGNVRNWEQKGRASRPDSAAVLLVRLIARDPEGVEELVKQAREDSSGLKNLEEAIVVG